MRFRKSFDEGTGYSMSWSVKVCIYEIDSLQKYFQIAMTWFQVEERDESIRFWIPSAHARHILL